MLLTDEIVLRDHERQLESALLEQPAWSALPVVVLARETVAQRMAIAPRKPTGM